MSQDEAGMDKVMGRYWESSDYPKDNCGMDHYSDPDHCTIHCRAVTSWWEKKILTERVAREMAEARVKDLEAKIDAAERLLGEREAAKMEASIIGIAARQFCEGGCPVSEDDKPVIPCEHRIARSIIAAKSKAGEPKP